VWQRIPHEWCGLSANLECRSEMCCTRLAEYTGRTTLSGCTFAPKACIDNPRKNFLNSNISSTVHMSSQFGELQPTNIWDQLASLGHPANFNGFHVLASLLHRRRSLEVNQTLHGCLAISWAGTLYTFSGALASLTEFCQCKIHFASKSCVLLYWQHDWT